MKSERDGINPEALLKLLLPALNEKKK